MKFTNFLEDDKKAPTDIDARKLFAPKEYHTTRKIKIERLAFVITILVLMIALASSLFYPLFVKDSDTSKSIDEPAVMEPIQEAIEIPHADLSGNHPIIETQPDKAPYETMPICSTTSTFKSWMDYTTITSTSSRQWKLQQQATDDDNGFRKVDKFYTVAMASQYGPVGTKHLITFSSGILIYVVIGDVKANTTCQHDDTSMLEFIVNSKIMPSEVKESGNFNSIFEGTITEIKIIN